MTAYAIATLRNVNVGADIAGYLKQIDATLAPYDGRFIVHGGAKTVLEGDWAGDVIVIAFPDRAAAEGWYASAGYQAILPLRLDNADSDAIIVDGVGPGHRGIDALPPGITVAA